MEILWQILLGTLDSEEFVLTQDECTAILQLENISLQPTLPHLAELGWKSPQISLNSQNITDFHLLVISELLEINGTVKRLTLSDNRIRTLNCLGNLKGIMFLDLANNEISDINPLSHLKNLQTLKLDCNHISSIKPLESLVTLEILYIRRNQLSCLQPLLVLPKLQRFYAMGNKISSIPDLSVNLGQYTVIELTENKIDISQRQSLIALAANLALSVDLRL